ncbi:MAG TPA: cytochrome c [Chromatiaceae bacterium]|nr:cytochrome c [Chromatiaceae bacterium]
MNRFGLTLLTVITFSACHTASAHAEPVAARQAELLYLLKHDCGSCHGMRLEGGLGPALTPQRLQPLSRETLGATILHGRPGTPMPPWRPFISRDEALWLASQLKQGIRP